MEKKKFKDFLKEQDGRVTGFVDGANATQEEIMSYATQFE